MNPIIISILKLKSIKPQTKRLKLKIQKLQQKLNDKAANK